MGDGSSVAEMVIAVSTHNAKKPLRSWLRDVYTLGFRYLDVEFFRIIDEPFWFTSGFSRLKSLGTGFLKELKNWVDRGLISVVCMEAGALYVDDLKRLKRSISRIRKVASKAELFKCPLISVTPSSLKGTVPMDELIESCKALLDECSAYNVKIALENGEVGSIKILRKPEQLKLVMQRLNSVRLGICLDVAAAATVEFDVASYASNLIDHVFIVHINDITRDLRFKNLIVGLGDIDFKPLLTVVKSRRIPLVIEIYSGYGPIDVYLCKRQIEKILKAI